MEINKLSKGTHSSAIENVIFDSLKKVAKLMRQRLQRKSFRKAKDWSEKRGRFWKESHCHQTTARRPISFLKE
ncbi:hypothetical protein [Leptospira jelokensis]|uniref:hypothetical protein n=1 Tax=Leptospira jelokensis TaxID=2484931 RepID=UPI001AEF8E0A|nr:hypothetical protein [Leptospira jelokensis]